MKTVHLRPIPYPYKAILAICSDLDETPDSTRYFEIARFLNSENDTPAGRGVGLEVGNTIYFDMPDDQFAYWNTDDAARSTIRSLIKSGHIDCFHSFGDLATRREHAERALKELDEHGCRLECWVDHAVAPTNVGPDIMQGTGDLNASEAYHSDLTYKHGVRYVWRGRVTSVIGQNQSRSYGGLFSVGHPVASARTILTEMAKGTLARRGRAKYAMHTDNQIYRLAELRDGQRIVEFMRCNPYWGGVGGGATADGLAEVMTSAFLERLVKRQAVCILYTHLGKSSYPETLFSDRTIAAFRHLAELYKRGDLLVTTTRRLLGYCTMTAGAALTVMPDGSGETVTVDTSAMTSLGLPCDLSGLTIFVKDSDAVNVLVDGKRIPDMRRNPTDDHGRQSVSIPWRPLEFPLS